MKRILLWLLSTLTAVVLLFGYHTSTSSSLASSAPGTSVAPATTRASKSAATPSPKATTGTSAGGNTSSSGSGGSGGSGTSSASSTVTGDVVATQWGPVQVQLSLTGGRITKVTVLQQPDGNPRDEEINAYALPILTQETTQTQSAQIDMVSGATVTSTGYLQSLQSALDKAKG